MTPKVEELVATPDARLRELADEYAEQVGNYTNNQPLQEQRSIVAELLAAREALAARSVPEGVAVAREPVGWTNLYHLRPFLAGSSQHLIVIRKREPEWNIALYMAADNVQFLPDELQWEMRPARDGIEAQRGLNDVFPGDLTPVRRGS